MNIYKQYTLWHIIHDTPFFYTTTISKSYRSFNPFLMKKGYLLYYKKRLSTNMMESLSPFLASVMLIGMMGTDMFGTISRPTWSEFLRNSIGSTLKTLSLFM